LDKLDQQTRLNQLLHQLLHQRQNHRLLVVVEKLEGMRAMGMYLGILMLGMGMDLHLCMGMDQLLRLHNQQKGLLGLDLVHRIGLVHQGKLLEQLGQAHQLSKLARLMDRLFYQELFVLLLMVLAIEKAVLVTNKASDMPEKDTEKKGLSVRLSGPAKEGMAVVTPSI
jgi:hypothetical protein